VELVLFIPSSSNAIMRSNDFTTDVEEVIVMVVNVRLCTAEEKEVMHAKMGTTDKVLRAIPQKVYFIPLGKPTRS
jgi:hypothetical protein